MNWEKDEEQEVFSLLHRCKTLVLATTEASGEPAIAPVYYSINSRYKLDFVSKAATLHIQNIQNSRTVAGAVYEEGESLTDITGLQMQGVVSQLEGDQENTARGEYLLKYPSINQHPTLYKLFEKLPIFRYIPHSIRMTDHTPSGIRRRHWHS